MENKFRKCRICWSSDERHEFTPIYGENQLALRIFLCTQIKIIEYRSEGIPALICTKCLEELAIAVNFRHKVIKSEERLSKNLKFDILSSLSQRAVNIKTETAEMIKAEPNDACLQRIDNIEGIFGNHHSSFENVDIRCCENTETQKELRRKCTDQNNGIIDFEFKANSLVINPIKMVQDQTFNCKYCNKVFKHETYLRRHTTRVHSDERNKSNPRHKQIKKLNSIKNEDNTLYCEICQQFFTTRGSLQKHMKVKHEYVDVNDRYVCDYCGDLFIIKYYLIRHIRVKHFKTPVEKRVVDSPIPCEVCGKILRNRGLLKPHMRSHQVMTPNDYWYCDLCPRKFKTRGGCTWHIQQRHVLKATFKCPYNNCTVVYKGKWELKCHIKSKHTNQRDFRCEICGKGFLDRQKLQIHTRIHTGERPHACHLCTATFIHQTDLRRHIWGHTGERPLRCEVPNCGKGFMKKSELANHTNRCHASPVINFSSHYPL